MAVSRLIPGGSPYAATLTPALVSTKAEPPGGKDCPTTRLSGLEKAVPELGRLPDTKRTTRFVADDWEIEPPGSVAFCPAIEIG